VNNFGEQEIKDFNLVGVRKVKRVKRMRKVRVSNTARTGDRPKCLNPQIFSLSSAQPVACFG